MQKSHVIDSSISCVSSGLIGLDSPMLGLVSTSTFAGGRMALYVASLRGASSQSMMGIAMASYWHMGGRPRSSSIVRRQLAVLWKRWSMLAFLIQGLM